MQRHSIPTTLVVLILGAPVTMGVQLANDAGDVAVAPAEAPAMTVDIAPPGDLNIPLLVDEDGDTMTGDLAFSGSAGIAFGGGRLTGASSLAFGSRAVCLANAPAAGCGDVTDVSVSLGSGLLATNPGGPAVTLTTDSNVLQRRVSGTCASDLSITAISPTGSVVCGGGDITSVSTGPGLTGGAVSGGVVLSVASNGIHSGLIADGSILAADVNSGQVQLRVSASCPTGESISAIAAVGAVTCQADDGTRVKTVIYSTQSSIANPGSSFVKALDIGTFTKDRIGSDLVLHWTGHGRTIAGPSGFGVCHWELRLDNNPLSGGDAVVMSPTGATSYAPFAATVVALSPPGSGSHTLSIWVRGVNASECFLNPGVFQHSVIVQESD